MLSPAPVVEKRMSEARRLWAGRAKRRFGLARVRLAPGALLPYPIDLSPLLSLPLGYLDGQGMPYNVKNGAFGGEYQAASIAQYGLAQWNAWLEDGDSARQDAFMTQARWLLEHETCLVNGAGVWPVPFPSPEYGAEGPWLSAMTQGNAISVLTRAYSRTGDTRYLESARRALRPFEMDIFDGGVRAPVADFGYFFEGVATYPAARILSDFMFALFGLLDYVRITGDARMEQMARQSIETLHHLLLGYDLGYWSSYDLLHRRPASRFYHSLHIAQLRALAEYTGCDHCQALSERWEGYQQSAVCQLRQVVTSGILHYRAKAVARRAKGLRNKVNELEGSSQAPVLASITGFPIAGGMRGVLAGVSNAMSNEWRIEYLTRAIGRDRADYVIHPYERRYALLGREATTPSHYPNVLLYCREGRRMLARLMRKRGYAVVLPQDGAFTAAFTCPVAKRYGARVVTMDHGNVTLPESAFYRAQRMQGFAKRRQPRRAIEHVRFALYRRTLRRLIKEAVRASDTFLVAGDEVQETYIRQYNVSPGLIIRYPYWVDSQGLAPLSERERTDLRARLRLPARPVIIVLISRLTEEKGFDVAMDAIERAFTLAGPESARTCGVVIVGSGPLRAQIDADIAARGLRSSCVLWGEASRAEVADLLRASDIFLYAGKRGTNYSVAVLEAMAAGCAVVATTAPISNARLLADGRGISIPVSEDAGAMGEALARLISNAGDRRQMGAKARGYVEEHHSAVALRQALWRAAGWAPSLNTVKSPE